jgi:uncharacterized membrane protein
MFKIDTLKTLIVITIILALYDIIFLYLNRNLFNNQIEKIQGSSINIKKFSAILCYIALIFGLYYFIIKDKKSVLDAIILGLFVYSVYELTNMSLFENWEYKTVIIDTLWGGALFGLTTYTVYKIINSKVNNFDFDIIHPASLLKIS